MSIPDILAAIVSRMETSYSCLHPVATTQIPANALHNLASAMLQIHNTTEDSGTKAIAATAIKAIEGGT